MVAFTERFRYRLGKRLSRIAEPPVESVLLRFTVSVLSTNPVEYQFAESGVLAQALLSEEQTFYLQAEDLLLAPETKHALARLLMPEETIEATSALEELPTVSGNVFTPLGKHRIHGKSMSSKTAVHGSIFSCVSFRVFGVFRGLLSVAGGIQP